MIKSKQSLYRFLCLTEGDLRNLLVTAEFKEKRQPKRKYGEDQLNEKGEIRWRDLLVPCGLLKRAQQKIDRLLQQNEFPPYMQGSIPKRNHIQNALLHLNQQYFLTIDLKDFFSRISHRLVHQMFIDQGFSYTNAHYLTKLTTYRGGLPQGAPSSPVIANLVFQDTARQLFEFAQNHGIIYSNYLDDQSFSSTRPFKHLVPQILDIIKKNHFYPAPKKIHYRLYRCEITGLIVEGNQLSVMPIMKEKAKTNKNVEAYVNKIEEINRSLRLKNFSL